MNWFFDGEATYEAPECNWKGHGALNNMNYMSYHDSTNRTTQQKTGNTIVTGIHVFGYAE